MHCYNSADTTCRFIYGKRDSSDWSGSSFTVIEANSSCSAAALIEANRPSIAIDSNNCAHLAYSDSGVVKYATNWNGTDCSGSFVPETADGTGTNVSLVLDDDGLPYIFYLDDTALRMTTENSGSWVEETIEGSGVIGVGTGGVTGVNGRSN